MTQPAWRCSSRPSQKDRARSRRDVSPRELRPGAVHDCGWLFLSCAGSLLVSEFVDKYLLPSNESCRRLPEEWPSEGIDEWSVSQVLGRHREQKRAKKAVAHLHLRKSQALALIRQRWLTWPSTSCSCRSQSYGARSQSRTSALRPIIANLVLPDVALQVDDRCCRCFLSFPLSVGWAPTGSLGQLQTVNVWIGTAGTVTALHYAP